MDTTPSVSLPILHSSSKLTTHSHLIPHSDHSSAAGLSKSIHVNSAIHPTQTELSSSLVKPKLSSSRIMSSPSSFPAPLPSSLPSPLRPAKSSIPFPPMGLLEHPGIWSSMTISLSKSSIAPSQSQLLFNPNLPTMNHNRAHVFKRYAVLPFLTNWNPLSKITSVVNAMFSNRLYTNTPSDKFPTIFSIYERTIASDMQKTEDVHNSPRNYARNVQFSNNSTNEKGAPKSAVTKETRLNPVVISRLRTRPYIPHVMTPLTESSAFKGNSRGDTSSSLSDKSFGSPRPEVGPQDAFSLLRMARDISESGGKSNIRFERTGAIRDADYVQFDDKFVSDSGEKTIAHRGGDGLGYSPSSHGDDAVVDSDHYESLEKGSEEWTVANEKEAMEEEGTREIVTNKDSSGGANYIEEPNIGSVQNGLASTVDEYSNGRPHGNVDFETEAMNNLDASVEKFKREQQLTSNPEKQSTKYSFDGEHGNGMEREDSDSLENKEVVSARTQRTSKADRNNEFFGGNKAEHESPSNIESPNPLLSAPPSNSHDRQSDEGSGRIDANSGEKSREDGNEDDKSVSVTSRVEVTSDWTFHGVPGGMQNGENITQLSLMVYKVVRSDRVTTMAAVPCYEVRRWMPIVVQRLESEVVGFEFHCVDVVDSDDVSDNEARLKELKVKYGEISGDFIQTTADEVGLHLPRGLDMVVSWLGLQKWGMRKGWRFIKGLRRSKVKCLLLSSDSVRNNLQGGQGFLNVRKAPMLFNEPRRVIGKVTNGESRQLLLYEMDKIRDNF